MTLAVKILDRALKGNFNILKTEELGFKHRMWVYSGRRGVHCWISDERARKLSSEARRAIVSFLEVVKVFQIFNYRVVSMRKRKLQLGRSFILVLSMIINF
jgi:DNA primase catalytic subunit